MRSKSFGSMLAVLFWLLIFTPVSFMDFQKQNAYAKDSDVGEAVKLFKAGDKEQAKSLFLKAASESPENPVANYYLGVIYLEANDKRGAAAQWKEYIKKDPSTERSLMIQKNLTQLEIDIAKENAKNAVKNEAALMAEAPVPNSLAITYYTNNTNQNSAEYAALSKGMTAMLITDLSKVKGLQMVERAQIQALMDEIKLGMAGFTEKGKAPQVGKLLKAEHVAGGNYTREFNFNSSETGELVRMDSSVVSTANSKEVAAGSIRGNINDFWDMEKKVAVGILTGLGYAKKSIPDDVYKIHTTNFEAFKEYSTALDKVDSGDLASARKSFENAVKLDPGFGVASNALNTLPSAFVTTSDMAASANAAGWTPPPPARSNEPQAARPQRPLQAAQPQARSTVEEPKAPDVHDDRSKKYNTNIVGLPGVGVFIDNGNRVTDLGALVGLGINADVGYGYWPSLLVGLSYGGSSTGQKSYGNYQEDINLSEYDLGVRYYLGHEVFQPYVSVGVASISITDKISCGGGWCSGTTKAGTTTDTVTGTLLNAGLLWHPSPTKGVNIGVDLKVVTGASYRNLKADYAQLKFLFGYGW